MGAVAAPAPTTVAALRQRGRLRGGLPLLGPAFVAAIAYVDPGNFATNFAGGTRFGYLLIWVIVAANLMAMLVQSLAAKLGLATGRNLAELCREHYSRPVARGLWVQGELVAMATDLAEVIGGAIALNLLFGLPLLVGGLITAAVAFGLLGLQRLGYRRFEVVIAGLLGVILLGFLAQLVRVQVDFGSAAAGLVPRFAGTDSLLLATGILGATVMPHAIYLHSALTQHRVPAVGRLERRHVMRHHNIDVTVAMGLAGVVNLSMLVIAAALFAGQRAEIGDSLAAVHRTRPVVGSRCGAGVRCRAARVRVHPAGVGTLAGQIVMQGFIRRSIPVVVRRAVTLFPAIVVLGLGVDPTYALVLSQVVLSFGLPFALVPLVRLTAHQPLMGDLVNRRVTTVLASGVVAVIVALNGVLLVQTFS